MDAKKPCTIHDVARLSGASIATVSRVMNHADYPVSEEMRKSILRAAEELHFTPSDVARRLKRGPSTDIGVIFPTIENPFYASAMLGIERAVYPKGYNILLCNSFRQEQREREYLQMLFHKRIFGVIVSAVTENGKNISKYAKQGMRFVLLDQRLEDGDCANIQYDARQGASIAVEYLFGLGHRRIGLAATPMNRWTRRELRAGYLDALKKHGDLPPIVYEGDTEDGEREQVQGYEYVVGRQLAERFVRDGCPATALFCINDMLAIAVVQSLMAHGVRVPEDVSVVGFDDIPLANVISPRLTTVRCSAFDLGWMAGQMLVGQDDGESPMQTSVKVEPHIIERETTRAL